jgi:outer membrane protein assembly factor BamB
VWLSGRLQDVWSKAEGPPRDAINRLIDGFLASAASPADRVRHAMICRFHPAAAKLERSLAEADFTAGRIASGELRLLRLSRQKGAESVSDLQALATAVEERGLADDANFWLKLAHLRRSETEPALETRRDTAPADAWGDFNLSILRTGGFSTSEPPQSVRFISAELPFYRSRSMKLVPDRLSISGPNGVGLEHLIPLQADNRSGSHTVAVAEGHVLFMLYRGMLQAVSPLENRVLWSLPVPAESFARTFSERPVNPMRSANSLVATAGSVYRSRMNGSLAAVTPSYVALERRREITVVDAATGELRWTRSGWPQNAVVVGTDSLLYVLPSDGRPGKVLRAIDGQEIALPQAAANIQHAVAACGDRLLLVVQEPTLTLPLGLRVGGGATVSLYDPFTGTMDWKRTYPSETLFEVADDGSLVVLTPDGTLAKIDTATGKPSKIGELPPTLLRRQSSVVFLEDGRSAYAIVNVGRADSSFAGIATLAVNGEIFAFDEVEGRLRWHKEVSHRRLVCEDFGQMPALLFIDNEHGGARGQNVPNMWRVNLLALDKRSGEPVLDETELMNSSPVFRGFSVEPERRSIRLLGFNMQLRLVAVEKEAAPSPPTETDGSD